ENPLSLFSISPSFFDISSGLILSLLIALVLIQKKKLPILIVLDSISLPLLVFLVFLFLSLFASGNFYGKPSTIPWAITLWGTTRHPLQLYYLIGLIPLIGINVHTSRQNYQTGDLFFQTIFTISILVIFLDYFNGNPNNQIASFNILQ